MRARRGVRGLALIFVVATLFAGCDWSAVGFDPGNTNFNPSEPALTEASVQHLKVAWSAPCACEQRALVVGGVVYVIDGFSGTPPFLVTVRAFDASSGKARWSTPLGAGDIGTELSAIANGLVYVLVSPSQRIVALDAATGVVRWQMTPPEPGGNPVTIAGPIIVDGPLAFVAAFARTRSDIFAIDTGGHVVWSASPGSALAIDPAQHTVYTLSLLRLTHGPSVYVLTGYAEADGTVRSAVVTQIPDTPPVGAAATGFSNGLVFGSQSSDHSPSGIGAFALHPDTGALAWSGDATVTALTPNAVVDFFLRGSPNTTVRNPTTGAVLWQTNTLGGAAAVAGGLIYTEGFGASPDLVVLRLSNGSTVATVHIPGVAFGALTPTAGHLYDVDRTNNHLYALAPT